MISATKPKRVLVRPKPYYLTIPVLTEEVRERLSQVAKRHGECYGPDYWKRIRRGERPSLDRQQAGASAPAQPGEPTLPALRAESQPASQPARIKFSELKPHAKRLVTKYGRDYWRDIKKGIRPSEERKKIRWFVP
jgi:hypothetical protein